MNRTNKRYLLKSKGRKGSSKAGSLRRKSSGKTRKSESLLKMPVFMVSIVGITFSSIIILFLTFSLTAQGTYTKPASLITNSQISQNLIDGKSAESIWNITFSEQASPGIPIRLRIPKINVDTILEHVGLTPQGAVDVPKDPTNAAWFNLGPRPGDNGSAVITGHYGWWKDGTSGVFNNLSKLKKGDKIYVQDDKEVITTFVISEFQTYDPNADVPEVFGLNDGKVHLNLITCKGVWNKSTKQYSERLVVFADKEEVSGDNLMTLAGVTLITSTPTVIMSESTAPAVCTTTVTFTKFLSVESTHQQVYQLQYLLQCLGYFSADVALTGYFGSVTEDSVKKFQSANGIEAAGYVGPATRSILNHYVVQ